MLRFFSTVPTFISLQNEKQLVGPWAGKLLTVGILVEEGQGRVVGYTVSDFVLWALPSIVLYKKYRELSWGNKQQKKDILKVPSIFSMA